MSGRILVTGSDGFIGSHLVEELVRRGRPVRAFVLYNSFDSRGWLDSLPAKVSDAIEVFAGDVRDPGSVLRAMDGCEGVLHLAALIGIPYSYHAPDSYVDTNVRGTLNVLEAARKHRVNKIAITSTSEVYGTAQTIPITEDHPLVAQSPYAATKTGADQLALSYHRSFGLPVAIARPFNTYGPRQSARAVIPTIITQIAAGQRTIKLGSLQPTRDFSYVNDTVRGLLAIYDGEGSVGEVINLGSGFEISVGDTAKLIAEVMKADVVIKTEQTRTRPEDSEVERLWASVDKAHRLLQWKPEFGGREGFKRGLAATVQWFADPANRARYRTGQYIV